MSLNYANTSTVLPDLTKSYSDSRIRAGIVSVSMVFDLMGLGFQPVICGQKVSLNGKYLQMLREKGTKCLDCGLEGQFFAVEKHIDTKMSYKLKLYGVRDDGRQAMITKDHIKPVSKGGSHNLDNLQPLCYFCNTEKGNKYEMPSRIESSQALVS